MGAIEQRRESGTPCLPGREIAECPLDSANEAINRDLSTFIFRYALEADVWRSYAMCHFLP